MYEFWFTVSCLIYNIAQAAVIFRTKGISLSLSRSSLSFSLSFSPSSLLLPTTTLLPMSGNARHVFSLAAPLVSPQCKARLMCHDLLCHTQGKPLLMHMIVASALTWF